MSTKASVQGADSQALSSSRPSIWIGAWRAVADVTLGHGPSDDELLPRAWGPSEPAVGRHRLEDLGQEVGLRCVPHQLEVARAVGVVEDDVRKCSPSIRRNSIFWRVTLSASASRSRCRLNILPLTPMTFIPGARPARSPIIPGTTSVIFPSPSKLKADRIPSRDSAATAANLAADLLAGAGFEYRMR